MVSVADAIRILITGDGTQAISEFKKVGAAADQNLKKAQSSSDKLSSTLTKTGVIAATSGIAIGAGLFKAAQAASEADLAQQKLLNTIHNSPALAGASTEAFNKQADALEKTTINSHVTTTEIQAMLGQFKLTQAQILEATPLVEDLANKFGIDGAAAAKKFGLSVNGTGGQLQRLGIITGVTKGGTDNFNKTVEALRHTVGGFSVQEGKTFSGQIAIIKNELKRAEETIGAGAIPAFRNLGHIVGAAGDAFGHLGIHISGEKIGEFATYGATALVVGGSISFVAGQVIKFGDRLGVLKGKFTGATVASEEAAVSTDALAVSEGAAAGSAATLAASETKAVASTEALGAAAVTGTAEISTLGAELGTLGTVLGTVAGLAVGAGIIFGGKFDTSSSPAIKKTVDNIDAAGKAYDKLKGSGVDFTKVFNEQANVLKGGKPAFDAWAKSQGLNATQTKLAAEALGLFNPNLKDLLSGESGAKGAIDGTNLSIGDQAKKAKEDADHLYAIVGATNALHSAQRDLRTSVLDNTDAQVKLLGAQQDYDAAVKQFGPHSAQAVLASEALQRAQIDAGNSLDGVRQKALDAAKAVAGGSTSSHKFASALENIKAQFPSLAAWIDVYISKLGLIPAYKNTQVTINGQTANVSNANGGQIHIQGGPTYHASGGSMSPNEWGIAGEAGAELLHAKPGGGVEIFSNARSKQLVSTRSHSGGGGSGGGDTYVTQHITISNPDPSAVADAILKHSRYKGTRWIKDLVA